MGLINFYTNALKGKEKPWKIFVFGFLLVIFFWTILLDITEHISRDFVYFLVIVRLVYSYWLVIAFWNCAINASNRFFNVLTRIMAALIAMQIFDALDILIRYSK